MDFKKFILLLLVMVLAAFLRFYQLDQIPAGLNFDESSMGYNAYSVLETGKDRYGKSFPILFRSFGSFQAPLYTYLTVIPVKLFGASIFSTRLISVLSGIIIVLATFLIVFAGVKRNFATALLAAFIVAISPWAVFFGRVGTEASLALALFSVSVFLFILSLNRHFLFIPASFILGLTTHAYYSERLTSILFLFGLIWLFRKKISNLNYRKYLLIGITLFIITQIPHLMIATTGALTRRLNQVSYWNDKSFYHNAPDLSNLPFGRGLYIIREFSSQYIAYFSPKNLFFEPDPQPERSIPDLSVFYDWMFVPFLFGIGVFIKRRSLPFFKTLLMTTAISPIPAALTTDPFYTTRSLGLFWVLTIIIALGLKEILNKFSINYFKYLILFVLIFYSLITLYISYFILLKRERAIFDYSYTKVLEKTIQFPDKKFVVDSLRQPGAGVRYAFLKKYDPNKLQMDLGAKISNNYYGNFEMEESYNLGNIEARPINWKRDVCKEQILVGDNLAISEQQIKEHKLIPIFEIKDRSGEISLLGFLTNPKEKCFSEGGNRSRFCIRN